METATLEKKKTLTCKVLVLSSGAVQTGQRGRRNIFDASNQEKNVTTIFDSKPKKANLIQMIAFLGV